VRKPVRSIIARIQRAFPKIESGIIYHVYNRANGNDDIFREPRNYNYFLTLCAKYVIPVANIYAYCLLKNHFHFLVRIKNLNNVALDPTQQFSNWFNAYAKAYNKLYQRTGSLFQRPFERIPVSSETYLINVIHYIHHNPVKHGFVSDFREWEYSSYHALRSSKATHLSRVEVLDWFGGSNQFEELRSKHFDDLPIREIIGNDLD